MAPWIAFALMPVAAATVYFIHKRHQNKT